MALLQKWLDAFTEIGASIITGMKTRFSTNIIDDMLLEVALTSLHEEEYKTDEVKGIVSRIKEEWSNSPETPSQFAESLMSVVSGQIAKMQLENMVDIDTDINAPVSKRMFEQLGIITDISLLASTLSIIGEVASIGQIDMLGQEIRSYLDYSGLSQITGFGYGMMLSNAVSPLMTQEINEQVRPALLDVDRALNMTYRDLIDEGTLLINLRKQGYTDLQISQLKEQYMFYPAPTDFIRFAVREVFSESVVDKWGYDRGFPTEMAPYVKKAGMSMDILKWYWRAHWELPSPNMGYQMLHRGVLSAEELEELLQLADYAPGYIDKMIAISYSPYTRVDAKRMFDAGVLDEEGLKQAYKDIGYDEEKANNLLEWVKIDSQANEKDLTRSLIINAYEIGLIDRPQTIEYVIGLGYDADEAELIIAIEDNKREQKEIEAALNLLRAQYAKSIIDDTQFENKATDLGLSTSKIAEELLKAKQARDKIIVLPSRADLDKWLKLELITELQYEERMREKGYQDRDIYNYIRSGAA